MSAGVALGLEVFDLESQLNALYHSYKNVPGCVV